ncbi:MAG: response regulator [Anaerolinea sp.]|nr:response regulator [Anaerolinea sp.]
MIGRKRLLLIEDDNDVSEMLDMYFGAHQYEVILADTGSQGIELARTRLPNLILLDVMLPDVDGYEVCRLLRAMSFTRYIPIIFLTQRDERANRVKGLALGADDYITKPFDIDELRLRVQSSIQRATRESLHETRTGLPTGKLIEDEINRRVHADIPFQRIDVEVDGFKQYTEVYGFMAADNVISYTGRALCQVISQHGTPDDFVGIVGDRFVVLTQSGTGSTLLTGLRGEFDQIVRTFYSYKDAASGCITVNTDDGERQIPLMSLSIMDA